MAARAWPAIPPAVRLEAERAGVWAVKQGRTYGLPADVYKACDGLKRLWRAAHPHIERFWTDLEDACRLTVMTGRPTTAGRINFQKSGTWLRMVLPSGRCLCYPGARYENSKLSYMGVNPYTRQWSRIYTYGGKIAENATQALARDLLCETMLDIDVEAPVDLVGHVHDEAIAEAELDYQLDEYLSYFTRERGWSKGLPLAAAGFATDRYRKD
jgi:DNA polymerase